jgi:NAD(P)H-flavin reductase
MSRLIDSEWLREALQFSLSATSSSPTTSVTGAFGPPEERDSRFKDLIQGVNFTRSFIHTYPRVILSIISVISVFHWIKKALFWRKRRSARLRTSSTDRLFYEDDASLTGRESIKHIIRQDNDESPLSENSTLRGTETPPAKVLYEDEETPLLHDGHHLRPPYLQRSIYNEIRGYLMYQPRPIPVVNKVLPTNGLSIIILAFVGLNVFYTLFNIKFAWMQLFVFADRCGAVFIVNLPFLYLLAAKTQPLRFLTGYSYESLNILHRRLGEVLCLEGLLHSLGMFGVWYTLLHPRGRTLMQFLFSKVVYLGIGAFFCYQALYFTSLASFRRRWYELFLGLHIFLQLAALIFLYFHHHLCRPFVMTSLIIIAVDRLVYRIGLKSTTGPAEVAVMEDGDTVKLSTMIGLHPKTFLDNILARNIRTGWEATDHVFVTIPSLSRKHIVQAHPFTIMSSAPVRGATDAKLELLIRAQGGFSADLLRQATRRNVLMIRIDGPYGSSHARNLLLQSEVAILIAGGSGIAVCWPLIQFVLEHTRSTDTEIASTSEARRQKIYLLWIIHKTSHISWIGRETLQRMDAEGIITIIPQATEEAGRPNIEAQIDSIVERSGDERNISVVGSGPDSMNRSVQNTCARLVRDGRNVAVAIEKFGW